MREFFIDGFRTRWRVRLLNFDDPLAERFPPASDGGQPSADLEITYFKDKNRFIEEKLKKGRLGESVLEEKEYGASYFLGTDRDRGSVACFFEKGLPFSFVLARGVDTSFLTFQDRIDVIFLHSSSVIVGGKAYLFVAPDEGGKSTVYNLAREKGYAGMDDDSCVVKKSGGRYYAQTYPFHFLPGWGAEEKEIAGLYFLERSNTNRIKSISRIEALRRAVPETERLFDSVIPPEETGSHRKHIFNFLDSMFDKVSFNLLYFKKDPELFTWLLEGSKI